MENEEAKGLNNLLKPDQSSNKEIEEMIIGKIENTIRKLKPREKLKLEFEKNLK